MATTLGIGNPVSPPLLLAFFRESLSRAVVSVQRPWHEQSVQFEPAYRLARFILVMLLTGALAFPALARNSKETMLPKLTASPHPSAAPRIAGPQFVPHLLPLQSGTHAIGSQGWATHNSGSAPSVQARHSVDDFPLRQNLGSRHATGLPQNAHTPIGVKDLSRAQTTGRATALGTGPGAQSASSVVQRGQVPGSASAAFRAPRIGSAPTGR